MLHLPSSAARVLWLALALTVAACTCEDRTHPAPSASRRPPAPASASAAPTRDTSPPARSTKKDKADRTHRASRCGECHEKMYDEWLGSAHAKSDDSPAFRALHAGAPETSCQPCHAPLARLQEPSAFAAAEGVSCEVCHRIEGVEVARPSSKLALLRTHEVKFGPRCDPSEPYFHRARCLPLFQKSELCAGCHQLYQPVAGGEPLPVHTEYADFRASVHAARGKSCQSCHMPGVRAELATGERERENVPDHGFLGHAGELRGTALSASATAFWQPGSVKLNVRLKNARAGHAVPAGAPGRQLLLTVAALDASGKELARDERTYGRRLVDAAGHAAPFYAAVRVDGDTRIPAGASRQETMLLEQPEIASVRVELSFRALEPELASRLKLTDVEQEVVAETTLAIGPGRAGSRSAVLAR